MKVLPVHKVFVPNDFSVSLVQGHLRSILCLMVRLCTNVFRAFFAMQCSRLLCFPFSIIYQVHAYVNLAYKSIVLLVTTKTVFFRVCFKVNIFWCMEGIFNCNKACP